MRRAADCVERPVRSFWDLDENLRIRIQSVTQMIVVDVDKVFVRIALAVGHHVLDVKDSTLVSPSNPRWQDVMPTFVLHISLCYKFFVIFLHYFLAQYFVLWAFSSKILKKCKIFCV